MNENSGQNQVSGTNSSDNLTGTNSSDILNGMAGDDILDGGAGADTYDGGAGNDRYILGDTDAIDTLMFNNNDVEQDILDISNLLPDSGVDAGNLQQFVKINSNGVFVDTAGTGQFSTENQIARFAANNPPLNAMVAVQVADTSVIQFDWTETADIPLIDAPEGTTEPGANNNQINGTAGADVLNGTASADTLNAQGGDDVLNGGAGADVYKGGDGNDRYVLDDTESVDTLYFRSDASQKDILDVSALLPAGVTAATLGNYLKITSDAVYFDAEGEGVFEQADKIAEFAENNPRFEDVISIQIGENVILDFDWTYSLNASESRAFVRSQDGQSVELNLSQHNLKEAFGGEGDEVLDGSSIAGTGISQSWQEADHRISLYGRQGSDTLKGNTDGGYLDGGLGDDRIEAGSGRNFLAGGAGQDEFVMTLETTSGENIKSDLLYDFTSTSEERDTLDLSAVLPAEANSGNIHSYLKITGTGVFIDTAGTGQFNEESQLARFGDKSNIDNLINLKLNDGSQIQFDRHDASNLTEGNDQADVLKAGEGSDVLRGNAGDDVLDGDGLATTKSADHLYGGEGNDTIHADGLDFSDGTVDGGAGYDRLMVAGEAGETVTADLHASGIERADGGASDDVLDGSGYTDTSGGYNSETGDYETTEAQRLELYGHAGDDTLTGGVGRDYLDGGADDDRLSGGLGRDFFAGGSGDDTFVLSDDNELDDIWDFKSSGGEYDTIDISAFTGDGFDVNTLPDFFHVDDNYVYFDRTGTGTFTENEAVAKLGGGSLVDNEYLKVEIDGTRIGYNPVTKSVAYVNTGGPEASVTGSTIAENSAEGTVVGQASYTDPDGVEPIEYIIASGNDQGFFAIDSGTGQVTLTDAGAQGIDFENAASHSLQIVATDRDFSSNPVELVINLTDLNDEAPVVSVSSSPIDENSPEGTVMGQVSATDADSTGESLTYAIASGNDQGYFAIDSATGEVTLTASGTANFDFETASSHTLSVTASDGTHTSTAVDFTIQLTNLNDVAPEVSSALDRVVQEDLSITVSEADLLENASDADGSALSVSNVAVASGQVSVVDNGDSTWTITPQGNWSGSSQLTFDISDGSQTTQSQLNLAVTPDADGPEFTATTATVVTRMDFEGGQLAADWTVENDAEIRHNSGYATPVEGEWAAELDAGGPQHGREAADALYYTVDTSSQHDHQISIWVKERGGNDGTDHVEIVWNGEVLEVIDPSATYGEYTVFLPDTDQATTQLAIREVADQNQGSGPIIDMITVARHDGVIESISDDYDKIIAGQEDKAFTLDMNVALADTDGSESLAVSLSGVPAGFTVSDGTNSVSTDGSAVDVSGWSLSAVTFTPAANYTADFDMVVTATATDGSDSATAREIIRVDMQAVAEAAVISGTDTGTVYEDANATLVKSGTLTVVDEDAGEAAFVAETVSGDYGSVSINANGYWVYSADNSQDAIQALGQNDTLSDTVTIRTADGTTHDITITIQGNNDAPKVDVNSAALSLGTDEDVSLTITKADFLTNIEHAEGTDSLSITDIRVEQGKVAITDNNDGTWTLVSDPNWSGSSKISYTVTDGAKSVRTRGDIEVRSVDDQPELVNPLADQSVNEDTAFSWQLPADTFTDGDGDSLSYSATLSDGSALPDWLSFDAATRTFSGTPDDPDVGVIQVKVTASDGALSSSQDVSITVNSVNDLPEIQIQTRGADAAVRLNASTEGSQEHADIAVRPDGGFVAVWADIVGGEHQIVGRFFDADAQPEGDEFIIDSGSDLANHPKVSVGSDGSFTVAWSDGVRGTVGTVEARSYSADGTPVSDVQATLSGSTYFPEILTLEGGDYVVATFDSWDGKRTEIQVYDNEGTPKSQVITTGSISGWDDIDYELVELSNGNWGHAVRNNYSGEIRFNIFEPSGDHVTEFTINNSEAGFDIASLADGHIAVVYGDQGTVKLRQFFQDGSTNGGEVDLGIAPSSGLVIESLNDGGFFVGWKEADGLFGQRFLSDGTPAGGKVTLVEDSNADGLSMIEMPDGSLKLGWHTTGVDGDSNAAMASKLVLPVDDLANGTVVATVSATDADLGDNLTYSLSNDAGGRYSIDENTGEITVADSSLIDYAQSTSHTVTVAVSDGTETVTMDYIVHNNSNNLAPETADSSVTGSEDISYVFSESDFPIIDPNANDYISEIRIESLPVAGSLTLSGNALAVGDTVSAADIQAGNLQFTGDANESGSDYASFTFNVADRMGLYSSTGKTMTVNLTAVNDAAVAGDVNLQGTEDTVLTFTKADLLAGATDVEGDALSVTDVSYSGSDGTLTSVNSISFGSSSNNQITLSETMQEMNAFTLAYEYTSTGSHSGGIDSVFSMATPAGGSSNAILTAIKGDGTLLVHINGPSTTFSGINLNDGASHNLALTWDSTSGELKLYDNNQLVESKIFAQGETIAADGLVVLGQDQDSYGGGFDGRQSLTNADLKNVTLSYDAVSQSDIEAGVSVADASNNLALNLKADNGQVVDTVIGNTVTVAGSIVPVDHYEFTPAQDFVGDISLNYTINDGTADTASSAVINVAPVNDVAVTTTVDLGSTNEDTAIVITEADLLVNASDIDGDALSVNSLTLVDSSQGSLVDNGDSTWTFTPVANFNGNDIALNYNVNDGTTDTASNAVIDVTAVADAAQFAVNTDNTVISSLDFENPTISGGWEAISGAPDGWSDTGTYEIHSNGMDGHTAYEGNQWMELDYLYDQDFISYSLDTSNGQPHVLELAIMKRLANTSDDIEIYWGGELLITLSPTTSWELQRIELPATDDPTTELRIQEPANHNSSTGSLIDAIKIMQVNIEVSDDPAYDYQITSLEDTGIPLDLGSVTSAGSETITTSLGGIPSGSTLTDGTNSISTDGSDVDISGWNLSALSLTPPANSHADFTITLNATATEANGDSAQSSSTLRVNLLAADDVTVTSQVDLGSTAEDTAIVITEAQLLSGATDVDGDSLSVNSLVLADSSHGTLVDNGDSTWTFTPTENFNGSDVALSYNVNDGTTDTAGSAVIDVTPVNDAAVTTTVDLGSTNEDTAIVITEADLLVNASDIEGDALSVNSLTLVDSSQGLLVDNGDSTWTFTPAANFNGNDIALNYNVNDGTTDTASNAVIDVTAVADAAQFAVNTDNTVISSLDFENPTISADWEAISGAPDGWSGVGTYEIHSNGMGGHTAYEGNQWLELDYAGEQDFISYSLDTSNGQSHVLELAVMKRSPSSTDDIEIYWGGELLTTLSPTTSWELQRIELPATDDPTTELKIQEPVGHNSGSGSLIDAIKLMQVNIGVSDDPAYDYQITSLEDTGIPLDLGSVTSAGSETITTILGGIPSGSTLTDGTNSVSTDGSDVDISGWNLSALSLTPPANSHADFTITLNATATEANGDSAQSSSTLRVNLLAINDAPTAADAPVSLQGAEDTVLVITKDQLLAGASDAEGDTITINDVSYSGSDGTLTEANNIIFGSDTDNRIEVAEKLQSFDAFSLEFEYTSTGSHSGSIDGLLSMSTPSDDNTLHIAIRNSTGALQVYVNDSSSVTFSELNINDGATHNITFTWDSATGDLKLFDNDQWLATRSIAQGETLPSDGWFMLGQDQDNYGGGTSASQSLTNARLGHMTLSYDAVSQSDIEAGISVADASTELALDIRSDNGQIVDNANSYTITTAGSISQEHHYEFAPNSNFDGNAVLDYTLSDGTDTTATQATLNFTGTSSAADETLPGNDGDNTIQAGDGNDTLIGGAGDDILTGGDGSDTFIWHADDVGTAAAPAEDTITDFSTGQGGDVINLSDVLSEIDPLEEHLSLNFENGDTTIEVKPDVNGDVTQKIKLEGVDLSGYGGGVTDAEILNNLINDGNLQID